MTSYYLTIPSIVVDWQQIDPDSIAKRFVFGDCVNEVPASALEAMIRLGQVSSEPPGQESPHAPESEAADWRATRIVDLDVSKATKAALTDAELATVADLLVYGAEHGTLTKIAGITEAAEKKIQAAIEAFSTKGEA
jgi:hypothetical protein